MRSYSNCQPDTKSPTSARTLPSPGRQLLRTGDFATVIQVATIPWIVDTPRSMDGATLRDYATETIRYWEPRRLFYNLLLFVVAAITFWLNLPLSRAALTIDSILWLFLLAVVA